MCFVCVGSLGVFFVFFCLPTGVHLGVWGFLKILFTYLRERAHKQVEGQREK